MTAVRTYVVRVAGCDDSTRILIDLTDAEAAAAGRIAEAVNAASESSCQPRMRVVLRDDATELDLGPLGPKRSRRRGDQRHPPRA